MGCAVEPHLGEIVAIEITPGGTGRVLLLGTIERDAERGRVLTWIEEIARNHMSEPESLMTLAWAIDARTNQRR